MSVKLPIISGERLIKILVRKGFSVRRQAGSHVVLQKGCIVFSVPLHEELKKGTLKAILNQSGLSVEDILD
jgi:predicted RNA binding protein YcfA (HicA-like mRNA interferase family)